MTRRPLSDSPHAELIQSILLRASERGIRACPAFERELIAADLLEALGPLHGYRIARRIEQISGNQLALNQGTLYPALLKLEQMGWISARRGASSESGRRVKVYVADAPRGGSSSRRKPRNGSAPRASSSGS